MSGLGGCRELSTGCSCTAAEWPKAPVHGSGVVGMLCAWQRGGGDTVHRAGQPKPYAWWQPSSTDISLMLGAARQVHALQHPMAAG